MMIVIFMGTMRTTMMMVMITMIIANSLTIIISIPISITGSHLENWGRSENELESGRRGIERNCGQNQSNLGSTGIIIIIIIITI